MTETAFISYSTADRPIVVQIHDLLKSIDFVSVWRDQEQIRPGDQIAAEIERGLDQASYFFIAVSKNSLNSQWVQSELSYAYELNAKKGTAIIPLKLDDSPMPLQLHGRLYIDFSTSIAKGLEKLREFLEAESTINIKKFAPHFENRCQDSLRNLKKRNLRYVLEQCLSQEQIRAIWYDLFDVRLENIIPNAAMTDISIRLVDDAWKQDLDEDLIELVCQRVDRIEACASKLLG